MHERLMHRFNASVEDFMLHCGILISFKLVCFEASTQTRSQSRAATTKITFKSNLTPAR